MRGEGRLGTSGGISSIGRSPASGKEGVCSFILDPSEREGELYVSIGVGVPDLLPLPHPAETQRIMARNMNKYFFKSKNP